jgi:hypothetical protein
VATGTDVRDAVQGVASGVLNTAAQLGTALGVAATLLVAAVTGGSGGPAAGAAAGWVGAGLLAALGMVFFALRRSDRMPSGPAGRGPESAGEQDARDGPRDRQPLQQRKR